MAGKTNTSATFFAQKKLVGKAQTSNLKTDGEELIGSHIQSATSLIFGETIPDNPARTLYLLQSASLTAPATVEYIQFSLSVVTGTTYDADSSGGGGGADSGEDAQSSGPHTYRFELPSDYTTNSSNPKEGNGVFDNGKLVHESLGALQLIPPFFSQTAPNPYIVKIYKDDGSGGVGDEIPLLDNIDWNVDYYNGILFLQDYNASKIPAHARAFAYIGEMSDTIGRFTAGISGSLTQLTDGTSFIKAGANITISSESNGAITIAGAAAGSGSPAGSDTQVQFNDGSSFGGDAGLTFNKTTNTLISNNLSGSLTQLSDGSSYLIAGDNTTITSASGGGITISSPSYVFNEFVGQASGTDTLFSLDKTPTASKNVSIFVNGQLQMPATSITSAPFQDYAITGSNIYFNSSSMPVEESLIMANYTTNDAV